MVNNMKKIFSKSIVLVLFLAFTFQSCTQNNQQGKTNEALSDSTDAVTKDTVLDIVRRIGDVIITGEEISFKVDESIEFSTIRPTPPNAAITGTLSCMVAACCALTCLTTPYHTA